MICTSINDVVVHGILVETQSSKRGHHRYRLWVFKNGFCGDSARTVMVGKSFAGAEAMVESTREALRLAIERCVPGESVTDIGWAVQSFVEPLGFSGGPQVRRRTRHWSSDA